MAARKEVEKQYPASETSRRVGWSEMHQLSRGDEEFVGVNVVIATVGEEGAEMGVNVHEPKPDIESIPWPYQKGFSAVAAFSGFIGRDHQRRYEDNLSYTSSDSRGASIEGLLGDGNLSRSLKAEGTERKWADSTLELLTNLRTELVKLNFEDVYAIMYYWMNGTIGRPETPLGYFDHRVELIADGSMRNQTAQQAAHQSAITKELRGAIASDRKMLERLTVFSDQAASSIPDLFIASRNSVRASEMKIVENAGHLIVKRLGYSPASNSFNMGNWPHSDTLPNSDATQTSAYKGLRAKSVEPATSQLNTELKELERRLTLSRTMEDRLYELQTLEKNP